MIVPDLNLLLYATVDAFPLHDRARDWWAALLAGDGVVGLVAPVVFGFVRLTTGRRVLRTPMTVDEATAYVDDWLARPNVEYLSDGPRQLQLALDLLRRVGAAGSLTTDAQIAAHALAVRGTVHTHDTDFARFEGVRWVDPLGPDPG